MRRLLMLLVVLLAAVMLAGCMPNLETDTGTGGGGEGTIVNVDLVSYEIQWPDGKPDLSAGTVTFHVKNVTTDGEEHSFEIEGNGIEEELEHHLQPGEEADLTVTLEPGTYTVYCTVEDHRMEGMEDTLTVK
jgi:plastocyanin